MAKPLRDIAPKGHFKVDKKLEGVNKSSTENAEVYGGKNASLHKNDPETVKFIEKHKVQKHEDRAGNKEEVYSGSNVKYSLKTSQNKLMGRDENESKNVYEETEDDEISFPNQPGVKYVRQQNGNYVTDQKSTVTQNINGVPSTYTTSRHSSGDPFDIQFPGDSRRYSRTPSGDYAETETIQFRNPDGSLRSAQAFKNPLSDMMQSTNDLAKSTMNSAQRQDPIASMTQRTNDLARSALRDNFGPQAAQRELGSDGRAYLSPIYPDDATQPQSPPPNVTRDYNRDRQFDYVNPNNPTQSYSNDQLRNMFREAKEVEEAKCNMTESGKMCPVHGLAECSTAKMIKEKAPKRLNEIVKKKVKEDLAMPMLEDGKKKKKMKEQADTPVRFPSGNIGDTGRV